MKSRFSSLLLLAAALVAPTLTFAATVSPQTLQNLNAAFQGESNANVRYLAYADSAEREQLPQVAKLFRAAAKAEAIHRDNHRATIEKLGGQVTAFELDALKPGTTADNLDAAVAGESYERDTMYPGFLATARAENNRDAERTFRFAAAAEKEHAALYAAARAQLGQNPTVTYYVCPVCGETVAGRPTDEKCGTCRRPTADFIAVQ